MSSLKLLSLLFFATLFVSSCSKDDSTDDPMLPDSCLMTSANKIQDATTSLGLFDVEYDTDGRLTTAGLQTYKFSYDPDGNVVSALLEETEFNFQVLFNFSYSDGKISLIEELWNSGANQSEHQSFTPTYDGNYVDKVVRSGFGLDEELNYDFDEQGNALKWSDPTFGYHEFTFDSSQKGFFEGLTHNQAFAYSIVVGNPFFHFSNAMTSEIEYNNDGSIENSFTFSDNKFNELGLQSAARDENGKGYTFDYFCE